MQRQGPFVAFAGKPGPTSRYRSRRARVRAQCAQCAKDGALAGRGSGATVPSRFIAVGGRGRSLLPVISGRSSLAAEM